MTRIMVIAGKLSDLKQQMLRLEYEGDEHSKIIAKRSQALLTDATNELQGLMDDLDAMLKK